MMRLDVEDRANIFKLSEGALEQVDDELGVIEEQFLNSILGRRLLPLHQLPPTAAFVVVVLPSSPLRQRRAPRRHLFLLSVTEDFVVVDCEEEEEAKEMISLWKKQGKAEELY
jgi:hypothetical protein